MSSKDDTTYLIVALLIGGAFLYSKQKPVMAQPARPNTGGGLAGNVGTGNNQVLAAGLFGSLLAAYKQTGNTSPLYDNTAQATLAQNNINFFKQNPVNDTVTPVDYSAYYAANPEVLQNIATYGI